MKHRGFTIIELLFLLWGLPFILALLLPSMSRARDAAMLSESKNNIRNIYMANMNYNHADKGRQWTGAPSNLAEHGDTLSTAIAAYLEHHSAYGSGDDDGGWSPGPGVQFGESANGQVWFCGNVPEYIAPYCWGEGPTSTTSAPRYGTFLHPNTRQIGEYMEDMVYNRSFFAPKDKIILSHVKRCLEESPRLCPGYNAQSPDDPNFGIKTLGTYSFAPMLHPSSYVYSPANMVNPRVYHFDGNKPNQGFMDPCTFNTGFRAPTISQAKYSSLKTYLMEHHWLQNHTDPDCSPMWNNAQFQWRNTSNPTGWHWDGCYPAMAVHSFRSTPVTCFADGHVNLLSINEADKDDSTIASSHQEEYGEDARTGTWHRGTPDGDNGYWHEAGTDWIDVSPHFHTAGGIHGRDILAD